MFFFIVQIEYTMTLYLDSLNWNLDIISYKRVYNLALARSEAISLLVSWIQK